MASERPDYNDKIELMHALAPVAFLRYKWTLITNNNNWYRNMPICILRNIQSWPVRFIESFRSILQVWYFKTIELNSFLLTKNVIVLVWLRSSFKVLPNNFSSWPQHLDWSLYHRIRQNCRSLEFCLLVIYPFNFHQFKERLRWWHPFLWATALINSIRYFSIDFFS